MEIRWKMDPKKYSSINTGSSLNSKALSVVYAPFEWRRDIIRAFYRMIDVIFHFFIMLIAMNYNAGLFIAIILGYGIGHIVFSRLARPQLGSGSLMDDEDQCH